MSKSDDIVIEAILSDTYKAETKDKPKKKRAPKKKKPEAEFNKIEKAVEKAVEAHTYVQMYSDMFEGGKEFLEAEKLPDLEIVKYEDEYWPEGVRVDIPEYDGHVWDHKVLYPNMLAIENNLKVVLVGPTGSGKTAMEKAVAAMKNQPYYRINGRRDMESDTLLGKILVNEEGTSRS